MSSKARRVTQNAALAVLMAGPTALAFRSGGFFDEPRLVAAIVAWVLVLVAAVCSPVPVPSSAQGRLAVGGLAALFAWTAASAAWAPLSAPATDDAVRTLLYLGALVASVALLRGRKRQRAVEPALALGALVVIAYGLAERLLPGVLDYAASARADGRLEQPLTYWNAEGLLAALGLVLCVRLAGDPSRAVATRALAAASSAPLGAGLYLSLSRGAMASAAVGLLVLLALAPSRPQARAAAIGLGAAVLAAVTAAAFPGVASLSGSLPDREAEGAIVLAILAVLMAASAAGSLRLARAERHDRLSGGTLGIAPQLPVVAGAAVVLCLAGLIAGGLGERGESRVTAQDRTERLSSFKSRRYDYWRTAAGSFAGQPLVGEGSGSFRAEWVRERPVEEPAQDAHSLALETAAELGLVGVLALLAFLGGVLLAARRAIARDAGLVAGAAAATVVWLLHATIDWDWEMPAVTLPVMVLMGSLVAAAEAPPE